MTKKEMKENLTKKCKVSWERCKEFEDVFGEGSVEAEKMVTAWATYVTLYEEFFNEDPKY